ncbi:D-erythro-7,8-dihydroneopterin triphosphate epimerase [Candidatus Brocadiaceae bacterium B188]|nr:dihydroneopterin aldolase [Candidatus Brocadia sapporoensis]QQR67939.1 MAG: dihydroneopterin aldolase [Candidatus Brocadia sp.]RZV58046.1 MAG: dihydroneopterin aldolase [Candidatus Brocadia sp. BROELEC01]TWU52798.1 D-erythro-7,8-dihydroneopterin triphosphate epimerase [Candidatus Brocadiaceae bacterium B188]
MKPDRIEINDLLLRCIIGINESERKNKQDVLINLVLWTDTRPVAASDAIEDALNYRTVTKKIIEYVEKSDHFLVERLVERIAKICLCDPRALRVQVSLEKPGALRFARSVGVTITRTRADFGLEQTDASK